MGIAASCACESGAGAIAGPKREADARKVEIPAVSEMAGRGFTYEV